jgi:hypothetical protein
MNKKCMLLTVISLITLVSTAASLEVDQTELKSAGGADAVVFKNYTGPHAVIDSVAAIRTIGTTLGKQIATAPETPETAGSTSRYYVIHAIDPNEKGKLDADIFTIGSDATVDHITNLRRIISAYLSAAYAYSDQDAATIATFITVYNAVYRGKLDAYTAKYKNIVMKNMTAAQAGLALSYTEWPGNSQIVIPLADVHGGISTIDTSVISDKQVVQSLQGEKDKGIDSRKSMVGIKEREADTAASTAQTAQKQATDESQKLKAEQAAAEAAQKKAAEAAQTAAASQTAAELAAKKAAANPSDKQAQKDAQTAAADAEQKKQAAEAAQKAAADQQQKTQEQAQKTAAAQTTAATAQDTADKKRSEAQNERTTIAQDQQTLIQDAAKNESGPVLTGLRLLDENGVLSGIVKINTQTGKVITESPVTVIRGKTLLDAGTGYIAIAGVTTKTGAVKLVLIDKTTLEITKESSEIVSELSVLQENNGSFYCIIRDGKNFVLAKFSPTLELQLKSAVAVKAATPVSIASDSILVTAADGSPKVLSIKDLNDPNTK